MPIVSCPECQADVSAYAETCPHCGFPINRSFDIARKVGRRTLNRMQLLGAVMLAAGGVTALTAEAAAGWSGNALIVEAVVAGVGAFAALGGLVVFAYALILGWWERE